MSSKPKTSPPEEGAKTHEAVLTAIADLKPHPRNYREHPDDQLAHIVQSLKDHGFYRNVVVARDGTILAGHGVTLAAKQLGLTHVPTIRLDLDAEDPLALKVLTGDNEIGRSAIVDDRILTDILASLASATGDVGALLGTGYDALSLAALAFVSRTDDELASLDAAKEWAGMPDATLSDLPMSVTIFCRSLEKRNQCTAHFGFDLTDAREAKGGHVSFWWPREDGKQSDRSSVLFIEKIATDKAT